MKGHVEGCGVLTSCSAMAQPDFHLSDGTGRCQPPGGRSLCQSGEEKTQDALQNCVWKSRRCVAKLPQKSVLDHGL